MILKFFFISDTPIRYFFYQPAQDFEHFHYVYNLIRDCKFRVKQMLFNKGQKDNFMSKDVIIKIGIAGHFNDKILILYQEEHVQYIFRKIAVWNTRLISSFYFHNVFVILVQNYSSV